MTTLLDRRTSNGLSPQPQRIFAVENRLQSNMNCSICPIISTVDCITTVRDIDYHLLAALKMTTSGVPSTVPQTLPSTLPGRSTQQAVNELRKLSGLTWDQLATLFNVSRRSVHFWASGQPLTSANEEKLNRILDVVEYISLGSASRNRSLLMDIADDGKSYLEMLAAGEYNRVKDILSDGNAPKKPKSGQLSKAAELSRMPPHPADLVDSLQDSIHREVGKSRAAKSVRSRNK